MKYELPEDKSQSIKKGDILRFQDGENVAYYKVTKVHKTGYQEYEYRTKRLKNKNGEPVLTPKTTPKTVPKSVPLHTETQM